MVQDTTAEGILERLSDLGNLPEETIIPYEEFETGDAVYYFTPAASSTARIPDQKR